MFLLRAAEFFGATALLDLEDESFNEHEEKLQWRSHICRGGAKTYVQAALLGGHLGVVPCRWR